MTENRPTYTDSPMFALIVEALGSDPEQAVELISAVQRLAGGGTLKEILDCITTHDARTAATITELIVRNKKSTHQASSTKMPQRKKSSRRFSNDMEKIQAALDMNFFEASSFISQVTERVPRATPHRILDCIVKHDAKTVTDVVIILKAASRGPMGAVRRKKRRKQAKPRPSTTSSRLPSRRYVWDPDTGSIEFASDDR